MDDEYMTNMNTDDTELLNKLKNKEEELTKVKAELEEKNQLCLTQKLKIEDFTIEKKDLEAKFKNQENLIKFYEERLKKDEEEETDPEKKDKIKQLDMQIMKLNDKIKELEESIIKKDNELEVVKQELEEEKEISQNALELINEKEDEIEKLKKEKEAGGDKKREKRKSVTGATDLSPEEVQMLKDEFLNQQEEFDQYKETSEKKN